MGRLILILLIIFILLTILRNVIRKFRLNPPAQRDTNQNSSIDKKKNSKDSDNIADAKFEEIK